MTAILWYRLAMEEDIYQFIARRKREIRNKIIALRNEYKKLNDFPVSDGSNSNGKKAPEVSAKPKITIKDTVVAMLKENGGSATSTDIMEFINNKHGKNYVISSISPQLSRLKKEGYLKLQDGKWGLAIDINQQSPGTDLAQETVDLDDEFDL